jgi:hypothetical protein
MGLPALNYPYGAIGLSICEKLPFTQSKRASNCPMGQWPSGWREERLETMKTVSLYAHLGQDGFNLLDHFGPAWTNPFKQLQTTPSKRGR